LALVFAQVTANAMEIEDVLIEPALELHSTLKSVREMSFTMTRLRMLEDRENAVMIATAMETDLALTTLVQESLEQTAPTLATLKPISLMNPKIN